MFGHLLPLHAFCGLKAALLAAFLVLTLPTSAADQYPPGRLTFQGHLTDAAGVPLGQTATTNVQVQFRLWRTAAGTTAGDLIWAEKQTVKVTRGFFNALLGAGNATGVAGEFFTNNLAGLFLGADASDRYLGVTVVGQGAEIAPRMQFLSSPFAHLARTTANLLNNAGQPVFNTAPGAVGVNTPGAPGATLDVGGTAKATTLIGNGSGLTGVPVQAANVTGTFDASRLADATVTGAKFASNSIAASLVANQAVTAAKLAPDAALALAAQAGGVPNGGVIVSAKKLDPVLHNMGYVNIGRANFDGPKWTIRATKDTPNAPVGRMFSVGSSDHREAATIWTGSKWIMYSGVATAGGYATDGASFDPALNSWTPISTVGAPTRRNEVNFIWTGTKGIFWGGHDGNPYADGRLYDPVANTWSPMGTVNEPQARNRQRNVWTGSEMFVWGGELVNNINNNPNNGGLYSLATNGWRVLPAAPIAGRRDYNAFWTGTEVLVWGGVAAGVYQRDGALYNPVSNTWRSMSSFSAPSAREGAAAVWTGTELIVWGGFGGGWNTDGGRYDVASDTWIPFNTSQVNFGVEGAAFWSGSKAYFLQGRNSGGYWNESGGTSGLSFDPANNKWDYLPVAPIAQTWMPFTWTGTELLTFATFRDGNDRTVLSFKPESETWFYAKTTPPSDNWTIRATKDTPNAPLPLVYDYSGTPHRSLWTGSKWLIWGGIAAPYISPFIALNTGAAFDPANNSWQPMAITNAPTPRTQFSAVWAGDQAIYWGGYTNNFIGDGKRFFPANNTWSNVTATGALSARCRHTAVWTGTEMLVWGGAIATGMTVTNNGARYNPATDTWTAMAAPPTGFTNRADHVAVWTGTEMLVWGGTTNASIFGTPRADGARYNPTSNTWTPMSSVNAPVGRSLALAVWTGTEMIVWGGYLGHTNLSSDLNTGGRYNPATDTWATFNTGQHTWSQESTAVWTGSKVIWAGGINAVGMVNRGGIGGITYNPVTGIVGTLPVAPIQQRNMPYTWTGTQLLTFGSWEDALDRTVLSYQP
ncbi:MAG: hypothetical protein ABMA26_24315 [Limisphaerales bacterium]